MTDSISIVVLNHNGATYLEACLKSLEKEQESGAAEVIVVDNASTDNSPSIVTELFPWARLVRSETNLGCSGGRNLGARESRGKIVWFLDSDAEVVEGAAAAVARAFDRDPGVGVVGCHLKHGRQRHVSEPPGSSIDRLGFVIPSPCRRPDLPAFFVPGCAMAVRRELLERLGLFDERYFIFWEEIDLCWRYRLAGYDVKVASDAIVYHYGGNNFRGGDAYGGRYITSLHRRYLGERNMLATLLKNYSVRSLAYIVPLYLILFSGELIGACLLGQFLLAKSYLQALGWNVAQMPETLRLRAEIQALRSVRDRALPFDSRWGKWLSLRIAGIPRFVP